MYKVYCDDYILYDNHLESLKIFNPKITMELNTVGSFTFTIYPNHPYFDKLEKLKSIISVFQDGYMIFRGRIINDINGFYNEKQVTCESELAFLLDSIQRPYEFSGSPEQLFKSLINSHNSQVNSDHQFKIGNVTVTDPNNYITRSDSQYLSTWESLKQKLIETSLGGYLWVRHEEDGNYIDYLEDFDVKSSQKIEFSKNLLDLKRTVKADDICTVLIPLGIKDDGTEERLTIRSVNDDKDYIEHTEGIAKYGRIVKVAEWDDVTLASNLLTKGRQYLDDAVSLINSIELTAADLSSINKSIDAFHLGTYVELISKPHNIDRQMLVNKISIDLLNPANNKMALDISFNSMTEQQNQSIKNLQAQVVNKIQSVTSTVTDVVDVKVQQFQSSIESTSTSILTTVSDNYYVKSETDRLINSVKSTLEQTSSGFEMKFDELNQNLQDVVNGTDSQFQNISKYIRFVDGKIILGEVGNELELNIANDKISFMQQNSEVAYFSNNKLFVTDGEYTNSLQLGKFAFIPRASGNLSFRKVVE